MEKKVSLRFECKETNKEKLSLLIDHYQSCEYLIRYVNDLKREFSSAKGALCLERLFYIHAHKAYWHDLGGES
jgi:hypothetical protein